MAHMLDNSDQGERPKVKKTKKKRAGDEPGSSGAKSENAEASTFAALGVCDSLCDATRAMGFERPTHIQREAIPQALQGRDVIGLAQTGSGKTAAFALPIIQALLKEPRGLFSLCLAPTRELAFQIAEQFEALGSNVGIRVVVVVGGIDMMTQAIALAKKPHVIVATPGRLLDHLHKTKGFTLKTIRFLVLDEADRMLNMDFEKEIDEILSVLPRDRRTFLFSATMTSKVAKLQRASLSNPVRVEVSSKNATVDTLIQNYLFIPACYKDCYLAFLLNESAGNSAIVFAGTVQNAQKVALMLRALGFAAVPLHGQMSQPKRLGALNKFKSGSSSILIATDVASRGLDIPLVDMVINYDLPSNAKDYIHRVGRTARAGRAGRAITLVTQYDVELYQKIEDYIGKKLDKHPCEEEEVLLLLERVNEAQRIAAVEMQESDAMGGKRRGKRLRDTVHALENPEDAETMPSKGSRMKKGKRR